MADFWETFVGGFLGSSGDFWQGTFAPHLDVRLGQVFAALFVLLLALFFSTVLNRGLSALLARGETPNNAQWIISRASRTAILFVGALWILGIFGMPVTTLLAVLATFGVAIALAMQDTVKNVVAGLYLLVENTLRIGDYMDMRGQSGRVDGVFLRYTAIRTDRGSRVMIPNNTLMNDMMTNRTWYAKRGRGEPIRVRVVQTLDQLASTSEADAANGANASDLVARYTERVRASLDALPAAAIQPEIVLESVTGGRASLHVDMWTTNRQEVLVCLFDQLRANLPSPDISVV